MVKETISLNESRLETSPTKASACPPESRILFSESKYYKKATTKVKFICLDGEKIIQCMQKAIETGSSQICKMNSKGYDNNGVCVSEFDIVWSLKKRK